MLNAEYLNSALVETGLVAQVLEAQGMDAIVELLTNLRSVEFPVAILESRNSGTLQLVEGPLDTYTESIWIMGQFGRGESESALYEQMRQLSIRVLAKILDDFKSGTAVLQGWNHNRTAYMKRYGGQNARGWELVLTFNDDISLL